MGLQERKGESRRNRGPKHRLSQSKDFTGTHSPDQDPLLFIFSSQHQAQFELVKKAAYTHTHTYFLSIERRTYAFHLSDLRNLS